MSDEVLAEVGASAVRRWIGIGMLGVIGVMSAYVAFAAPPEPGWQAFLVVVAVLALWMAERMRRATLNRIELTREVLRDTDGTVIARVAQIEAIDRGFLAFKPSNGFLISTSEPALRAWRPGLWWRMGRRVGVGGVAPGHQTRMMSDILAAMIAERDQAGSS